MPRKIVYYLKSIGNRNIVITDDDESMSDDALAEVISEQMASNKINYFETNTDIVLGFPGEISAVHIQKDTTRIKKKDKEYSFGDISDVVVDDSEDVEAVDSIDREITEAAEMSEEDAKKELALMDKELAESLDETEKEEDDVDFSSIDAD